MIFTTIDPDRTGLFVKNIMIYEETETDAVTSLPFFADGYPGLVFQETQFELLVIPHNKQMPELFLYGQTINPIELWIDGPFKLIAFQLYPFVLKSFFGITAKDINDGCYDLSQTQHGTIITRQLFNTSSIEQKVSIISDYLLEIFSQKKDHLDYAIRQSIVLILENNGQISIKEICERINLTERTFERRFVTAVGITAKQFSQIIRFNQSLASLSENEPVKISDIVYNNGYADQSHFIRVFKAFTGKTPGLFIKR